MDVVDAIGVDKATGQVVLTIKDPLEWTGEHILFLQEKLNSYLRFIESGELRKAYADSAGRQVLISILMKYEPDPLGRDFLQRAAAAVKESGFALNWQVLPMES
jgi:CRP-like cAMP-binding protein